jgi:hypothetical protein
MKSEEEVLEQCLKSWAFLINNCDYHGAHEFEILIKNFIVTDREFSILDNIEKMKLFEV